MPTGFIYSIVCNETGKVYYGSTIQNVSNRIRNHNCNLKRWKEKEGKYDYCSSYEILDKNNYTVRTLETVEFENKTELLERERFYIENNECINLCLPAQTAEERTEQRKEKSKIWAKNNKDKTREYKRRNYEKYKEKEREYKRQYYEKNKEKLREYARRYYEKKRNETENK